jgi:hypothetical protein
VPRAAARFAKCAAWSGSWQPRDTLPIADAGAVVGRAADLYVLPREARGQIRLDSKMSASVENATFDGGNRYAQCRTISCCWLSSSPRRRLDIVCPQ